VIYRQLVTAGKWRRIIIDHLPYIGSWKKPIQEKKGLVWAFQFSEKPIRSCCMGFNPQPK
jgi:hypothetical protein